MQVSMHVCENERKTCTLQKHKIMFSQEPHGNSLGNATPNTHSPKDPENGAPENS